MYINYHVFKYGNRYFVFSKTLFDYDEINAKQYDWLKKHESEEEIQIDKQLELDRTDSYFNHRKIKFLEDNNFTTGYFSFPPSHRCNLRCRYCFADGGENYQDIKKDFNQEDIYQICKFMMHEFLPNANSYKLDFASGGEPLLNQQFLFNSLVRMKENFEKNDKKLMIWLCTNGTCKDIDIVKKLSHLGVQIGISLDGDEKLQNEIRVYKNGAGTYQDVINFINHIQTSQDIKRISKQLWGLAVISTKTHSLVELHNHHKNIGFQSLQMKPVRLSKENDLSFNKHNLGHLKEIVSEYLDFLYDKVKENVFQDIMMIANENDFIGKLFLRIINQTPITMRCYAGRAKVSIAANGKVYPCDSFIGNEEFCLGDIWNGLDSDKRNLFFHQNVDNKKTCQNCWIKYICGGDCYHNSYVNNGRIDEPDSVLCEVNIHIVEEIIVFICNLQRDHDKQYRTLKRLLKMRSNL